MSELLPGLPIVFETKRLRAFAATPADAHLFYRLWTNPPLIYRVYRENWERLAGKRKIERRDSK